MRSPLILLILASAAASGAFWIDAHRARVVSGDVVIAALMLVFFICATSALFIHLKRKPSIRHPGMASQVPARDLAGTVYGLVPGRAYRILRPFTDYHGGRFLDGETLTFRERHFLPYHGGHTLVFEPRSIYLQETEHSDILSDFSRYVAEADEDSRG